MNIAIEGNDRTPRGLFQWDRGHRLCVHGIPAGTLTDFVPATSPGGPHRYTYEENGAIYVDIPDVLLQSFGPVIVYFYVEDAERGQTVFRDKLRILPRPKPAGYVYAEEEIRIWQQLQTQIDELQEKASASSLTAVGDGDAVVITTSLAVSADGDTIIIGGNA